MADNLENVFININKFINIDKERSDYTNHYEKVRNKIVQKLRDDMPFRYLFNGLQLGGSYGDNVKVKTPNEFDLYFHLKLPESNKLIIKCDPQMPGNVLIDLSEVLKVIEPQKQHSITFNFLKKWITPKNLLKVDNLQSWLQSCFQKVLTQMGNKITVGGFVSNLQYQRNGPAHTIIVSGEFDYSVDFVPGILLDPDQNILPTKKKNICEKWEAIPKPLKQPKGHTNHVSFQASYFLAEHKIINDNQNLKNALRILKKFRDTHTNMNNLKSYYIKTLFLWKVSENNNNLYWRSSLSTIVIEMFCELEKSLLNEKLPFFWNSKSNLYDKYTKSQLSEMQRCVTSAKNILLKASKDFNPILKYQTYCIFLDKDEQLNAGVKNPSKVRDALKDDTNKENSKCEPNKNCVIT